MLALEEFKKALGPKANSLSEAEIERIRGIQDKFADAFFDAWIKRKNQPRIFHAAPLKIPEKSGKINE